MVKRACVVSVPVSLGAASARTTRTGGGAKAGRVARVVAWCLAAALLGGWTQHAAAPAPPGGKPARGKLLVAARQIGDPGFSQTVVLLLDYDQDGGAMGVVVNQPTPIKLGTVLPDIRSLGRRPDRLWRGGPVLPTSLLVLVRSKKPVDGSEVVFEDVRMLTSRDSVRHVLEGELPRSRLRAYAGHAGWGPGQLEAEIARGDWIVMPAKAEQVFTEAPEGVWPGLVEHGEGQWTLLRRPRAAS